MKPSSDAIFIHSEPSSIIPAKAGIHKSNAWYLKELTTKIAQQQKILVQLSQAVEALNQKHDEVLEVRSQ